MRTVIDLFCTKYDSWPIFRLFHDTLSRIISYQNNFNWHCPACVQAVNVPYNEFNLQLRNVSSHRFHHDMQTILSTRRLTLQPKYTFTFLTTYLHTCKVGTSETETESRIFGDNEFHRAVLLVLRYECTHYPRNEPRPRHYTTGGLIETIWITHLWWRQIDRVPSLLIKWTLLCHTTANLQNYFQVQR